MDLRTSFDVATPESPFSSRQDDAVRVFKLIKDRDSDSLRAALKENRHRPAIYNVRDAVRTLWVSAKLSFG
jgi:hypothetical protein